MAAQDVDVQSGASKALCQRCHENEATTKIRVDHVCEKCFSLYINTKVVKRMETYKLRGSTPKSVKRLLLPLSLGPASTTLLSILDNHLQGQMARMGWTAYELVVAQLQYPGANEERNTDLFEKIKSQFPRHTFVAAHLAEGLAVEGLEIDWASYQISTSSASESHNVQEQLAVIYSNLPSATSKADLNTTLMTRLLTSLAKANSCTSILFGHSTTRLAEKVLTATAAGRGFSLPWQVSDGPSPHGVDFGYPLRDLLSKEIVAFSRLSPQLSECIIYENKTEVSASSKNTTIDELMAQYFSSVEENYPSIVANVVRTSSKLQAPAGEKSDTTCSLCGLPVEKGTDGIFGWGGDQSFNAHEHSNQAGQDSNATLCYGCSRSING